MDNLNQIIIEEKQPFNRKAYMKTYLKKYMQERYHKQLIDCDCGCKVHPYNLEKHQETRKHKYNVLLLNSS